MHHLILKVFTLACVAAVAFGDCYTGQLHQSTTGSEERYCLTKELKPEVVQYGRTLFTQDCYRCTCDHSGLHCCGFGIKAGTNAQDVPVPHGCILVVDGCNYYAVDAVTGLDCPIYGK